MDVYDDDVRRHEYHPSHSIPDAAYPNDSPYRPGTGGAGVAAGQQQSQYHAGGYASSTNPSTVGFGASVTTATTASSNTSSHNGSAWPPYDIPSSPPPPYDPSQAPSAYSPLDAATMPSRRPAPPLPNPSIATHSQDGRSGRHSPEVVPLQLLSSAASHPSTTYNPHVGPGTSTSALTQGSTGPESGAKFEAAMIERRRKQRRIKLCFVILAVLFLFFIALVIGIALGVLKGRNTSNNHDPDQYFGY